MIAYVRSELVFVLLFHLQVQGFTVSELETLDVQT